MKNTITLIVELKILPGQESALTALSKKLDKRHAEGSPGLIGFDYYIDKETQTGRLVEVYKSEEALIQHLAQNSESLTEVAKVYAITGVTVLGTLPEQLVQLISMAGFPVSVFLPLR